MIDTRSVVNFTCT